MGMADTVTKAYIRKNNIFADAFNYLIYEGKPVVEPERLREVDTRLLCHLVRRKMEMETASRVKWSRSIVTF